ncbi:MAG: tetratricopeptide repeat protein [Bacteroidales bacterium]|nr:tetratricopeptide repeat protein [Bacteroidales bacterium]MCL2133571.1 tetratricopeptide repeat protein [Bacteroidales bacterium]
MKAQLLFVFLLFVSLSAFAQADKKDVRKGNKLYKEEQYNEAAIAYLRALEADSTSIPAQFNLGNALYKLKQYEPADTIFKMLSNPNLPLQKKTKARIAHNLGNAALQQEKWQESVDAYKQSLRLNPTDDETRTNLAYAQTKLEKEQQGGGGGNDDKNQDDQNQDEQNQNQDQQNQQNQDKQDEQQEPKISPQQAQQMLEAMQANEKETQEKVNKEKAKAAVRVRTDKNW